MGLNAKQKEAVEYLEGPLLVLAGPGTGKTQLLSEKVAYILENTDTNPENILCLTFTESGERNMRERLSGMVGKAGRRVKIGTYHAFGREILAAYQNYSTDYTRQLDGAIDEVVQFKIVKGLRDGLPGTDILRGDSVKNIIEVISKAKGAGLSSENLSAVAKQNTEDSKVLSEAVAPLLARVVPRKFRESYEAAYQPIYEILKGYEKGEEIIPGVERSIAGLARALGEAISEAEATGKVGPLTAWRDEYFEKDGKGAWRLADRVANKKLSSVAKVMGMYQGYLEKQGLYDYDDMIQEAVRVLREDDGFRMTMQERYQFIMLDEFQDTNASQLSIVKLLTDYEKPLVMAVGDDDQAIYEFQGASVTNLKDFRDHYGAKVVTLEENYRSTQEILDFSYAVMRQAPDRLEDKVLTAVKPGPEKSQIERREFLASDAEYAYVAAEIAKLVASGVPQSEIAVISYKTKYFLPLLPYLKAYPEVKIAYEKRDDLMEDERIHELVTMARLAVEVACLAAEGPGRGRKNSPTVSMLEVLAYPCFRLPILEVVKLVGEAKAAHQTVFSYLLGVENEAIREVVEWISGLAARVEAESADVLITEMVGRMELDSGEPYEKFRFYENLTALLEAMRKHFGEKALHLSDLVEMVDDYTEAEMTLSVSSPYRDADEAVQILSAHKAKGLEFEHVFIISADHTAWGKGKGNNNLLVLPQNLQQIRHTGVTDGEKIRIIFVALTRAKGWLHITNSLHDFTGKDPARLEYLEETVEKDPETGVERVASKFLPSGFVEDGSALGFSEKQGSAENLRKWIEPYRAAVPDMRALYKERVANWRMSASSLTSFIDIAYAGPQEFFRRQILHAPSEPEDERLAMGNLVHKTFEMVTNTGMSDEAAAQFFLEELEKRELPVEVKRVLREKGPGELAVALSAFSEILRRGRAEVDLSYERLTIDGVPVTGKIDHIVVDEEAKTLEIYDFKTGKYHKEKWETQASLYKYMLQLGFYKLLLNSSPTYAKYRISKGHILFVAPDKDGEVYDKVYEFNEEDEEKLRGLMRAVYGEVESLEFLDDPEVFVEANKENGMKELKAFIELVLAKGGEV